ncbi:hypothetical protein GCM10027360_53330 [Amycolatopsis echigonensis]
MADRDRPGGVCPQHDAAHCETCDETFTVEHDHLDYVGHAHIRERLIEADAGWEWEPLGRNENGTPAFDRDGGLWIRLTVAGVTRLGYGDAEGRRGTAATKEIIGDALRNAGLSFGMALELWKQKPNRRRRAAPSSAAAAPVRLRTADSVRNEIRAFTERCWGWGLPDLDVNFTRWVGGPGGDTFGTAPPGVLERYLDSLKAAQPPATTVDDRA